MKRIILCLAMIASLASCSDDDTVVNNDAIVIDGIEFSNQPIAGTLYGEEFVNDGGRVEAQQIQGISSLNVMLTEDGYGCNMHDTFNFPVRFSAPAALGVHTEKVYATFNRPFSDDYEVASTGIRVEFTEITIDRVKGKVLVVAKDGNTINGIFDIPLCQ